MELNFYKGKTVLVTGDTGFKGSWLSLWLLSLGARVIGYALPPKKGEHFEACGLGQKIEHVDGDIRDARSLQKIINKVKPEIAFHLAAQPLVLQSYKDPIETFETNVIGHRQFSRGGPCLQINAGRGGNHDGQSLRKSGKRPCFQGIGPAWRPRPVQRLQSGGGNSDAIVFALVLR